MSSEYQVSDTEGRPGPRSELDLRSDLVGPQTDDEILKNNNFGTGVYSDQEYWQQLGNFEDHLYAIESLQRYLEEAAACVARHKIAKYGFEYEYQTANGEIERDELPPWGDLSEDDRGKHGERPDSVAAVWDQLSERQREAIDPLEKWVDKRYDALPTRAKLQAIRQFTDFDPSKRAVHGRLMAGAHELSRSKDGKLAELALGRFIHTKGESGQESLRQRR